MKSASYFDSFLKVMLVSLISFVELSLFISDYKYVEAHVSKEFGNIALDVGWSTEPPLIDERNNIIILVEDTGSGQSKAVINALTDITSFIIYGRVSKPIDFVTSGTTEGLYESEIIPTRVGSYSVVINGTIKGQPIVNAKFDIEEVEGKESISFPDKDSDASQDNAAPNIQSALSQLATEIGDVNNRVSYLENNSLESRSELDNIRSSQDLIYLVAWVSIGTGVGGMAIAAYFIHYRMKKEDRK